MRRSWKHCVQHSDIDLNFPHSFSQLFANNIAHWSMDIGIKKCQQFTIPLSAVDLSITFHKPALKPAQQEFHFLSEIHRILM